MYRVSGRSGATAGTDAHALAALWNPHGTARIIVTQIEVCATAAPGAGAGLELRRITARGTPGSTITPTIENDDRRAIAPPSGALLDLAVYSGQPTPVAAAGALHSWVYAAVAASGIIYPCASSNSLGITIPPSTGLALLNTSAIIFPISEVTFNWLEGD
jgi:hypothetical protein